MHNVRIGVQVGALTVALALIVAGAAGPVVPPTSSPLAKLPSPAAQPQSGLASTSASPAATPTPQSSRAATAPSPVSTPRASPASTGATSIVPGVAKRTSLSLIATYDVSVLLHYGDRAVSAVSTMSVRNVSGGPVDHLELNTVAARIGGLRLGAVLVDGRRVIASVEDQTIVVPLGGGLPNGKTAKVVLAFKATLRSDLAGSNWLFTRTNDIVNANRWIPWISLRRQFDRPNYGDPFVTASSPLVHVRITTDSSLVIAATGRRIAVNGLSQTFEARNVRDFNLTASPLYQVTARRVGGTVVRVYAKPGYPVSTVLGYATDALPRMGALIGPYPYADFTVAQSAGGDGMESPQLIWIPGGLGGRQLQWLVYHETAHQWFYGMVGSDQAYQPFADESAGDHLARTVSRLWRPSNCATGRLDLSIYQYTAGCYFETIYVQGSAFLDSVRLRMGNAAYWRAMRDYVAAHRFGIGSTRALLDALMEHASVDLRPMLRARFPSLY